MRETRYLLGLLTCLGIGLGLFINGQESMVQPHEAEKILPIESGQSNGIFVGNPRELNQSWDLVTNQDNPKSYILAPAKESYASGAGVIQEPGV